MELTLTVIGNNAVIQNKAERLPDNTVKTTTAKLCRIVAKNETAILQFTTDYEAGKGYELDKVLTVTIQ